MIPLAQWGREAIQFAVDEESGAVVEQLTSQPVTSTNIYPEQRYTSADGKRIAISRTPFGGEEQIWVVNMETLRLTHGITGSHAGANHRLNVVYVKQVEGDRCIMKRLNLVDFTVDVLFECPVDELPRSVAVSPDERYLVGGPYLVRDNIYKMTLRDLQTGTVSTLCEIPDMINPHTQFDPAGSGQVILQVNRGGTLGATTRELAGPMGSTLVIADIATGQVTPLPAGRPHTPPISGHECWAGTSGEVLYTAAQYECSASSFVTYKPEDEVPAAEKDMPRAAIYGARAGDSEARVVADGYLYNHIGVSDDGRYFTADDHITGRVYVGSVATGKAKGLCESHTVQGTCQYSHVHSYMTADHQWVIFNSIVSGIGQVYAARIPAGFLDDLD